ncbi:Alpha/Beta hydrolase protein [Mycena sanguinolenta]|nr:Alpha/Beta hydrolase protein [Mycena sanguinolenta]
MASAASLRTFLCAAIIFGCALAVDVGPVVDLGYAQYQGVVDTNLNITSFLGIRYASAPTGSLRWQAPTPPSNIAGIQQSEEPPQCFQGSQGTSPTNPLAIRDVEESEDCLFLNVYSPALNSSLPTIVWIHGGGYAVGAASFYNGSELVQEANNEIVVVVIQYRLALFGFLAGQEVKDGGVPNAGLLDQDFALRWVNKNVRRCTRPSAKKIQVLTRSTGAGSIIQHIVARNGKTSPQLFRAAMTSSTFLGYQYNYNGEIPQTMFNLVAAQAGCNVTKPLDCLRRLDSATLAEINVNLTTDAFMGTLVFNPVVDGSFITQSPTDALAQGALNTDILLSVTNANEGALFIDQTGDHDVADYVHNLFPLLGDEDSSAAASLYESFGPSIDQLNAILGESLLVCPTYLLLDAFSGKSYKGEYAIPPAFHGYDMVNYFPTYDEYGPVQGFNNTNFINAFTQGFLSFAVNLDPNVKVRPSIAPVWQKWSRGAETEMLFNKTELNMPDIVPVNTSSALLMRCEFWRSKRYLIGQ